MTRRRLVPAILVLLLGAPLAALALPRQNPFAARPAHEHELLKKLAGKWSASFAMNMPGAPAMKSRGTETNELLGALWLVSRYDDPGMMGGAFAGAQLLGFDPDKKKYVAAWADSQDDHLSLQEGSYDEATRTLTLRGTSTDPMSGATTPMRSVITWSDDDHRVNEMFVTMNGQEVPMFTIEYARAK